MPFLGRFTRQRSNQNQTRSDGFWFRNQARYREKAGMSNLLKIYSSLSGEKIEKLEKKFVGKTYSEFKSSLAETISEHFDPSAKRKKRLWQKTNCRTRDDS